MTQENNAPRQVSAEHLDGLVDLCINIPMRAHGLYVAFEFGAPQGEPPTAIWLDRDGSAWDGKPGKGTRIDLTEAPTNDLPAFRSWLVERIEQPDPGSGSMGVSLLAHTPGIEKPTPNPIPDRTTPPVSNSPNTPIPDPHTPGGL